MAKLTPALIDSSLWVDFTRPRSPRALKQFIAPYLVSPTAALAEPVMYEVLRYANDEEVRELQAQFDLIPVIRTPDDLWERAAKVGQNCRRKGISAGAMDLLIAVVGIHHDAEVITFDTVFQSIAKACTLRVNLLQRPAP